MRSTETTRDPRRRLPAEQPLDPGASSVEPPRGSDSPDAEAANDRMRLPHERDEAPVEQPTPGAAADHQHRVIGRAHDDVASGQVDTDCRTARSGSERTDQGLCPSPGEGPTAEREQRSQAAGSAGARGTPGSRSREADAGSGTAAAPAERRVGREGRQ